MSQHLSYYLRTCKRSSINWNKSWTNDHLLERQRQEQAHKLYDFLSYILPDAVWPKVNCHASDRFTLGGLCLAEDAMDPKVFLEYLPTLRRIAAIEKAADYAFRPISSPMRRIQPPSDAPRDEPPKLFEATTSTRFLALSNWT